MPNSRAALTWLAVPADPQLGMLLGVCSPESIVTAIRAGIIPPQYQPASRAGRPAMQTPLRR